MRSRAVSTSALAYIGILIVTTSGCTEPENPPASMSAPVAQRVENGSVAQALSPDSGSQNKASQKLRAVLKEGILHDQLNGVHVFFQPPAEASDSVKRARAQMRLAGMAKLVDGCLYVGDAVVIWEPQNRTPLEAAIKRLQAGEQVTLEGGGMSLSTSPTDEHHSRVPKVVTEQCPATTVWWAGLGG